VSVIHWFKEHCLGAGVSFRCVIMHAYSRNDVQFMDAMLVLQTACKAR
jgi:hypothetical protein